MSIDEVRATITAGVEAAEEAEKIIVSVRDKLRVAGPSAAATIHDSKHDAVTRGLRAISEADRESELTLRRLRAGTTAAGRYLGLIG